MSYMHVFCIFVFAPVQRNWACFTWKDALEIRSLLLLLFSGPHCRDIGSQTSSVCISLVIMVQITNRFLLPSTDGIVRLLLDVLFVCLFVYLFCLFVCFVSYLCPQPLCWNDLAVRTLGKLQTKWIVVSTGFLRNKESSLKTYFFLLLQILLRSKCLWGFISTFLSAKNISKGAVQTASDSARQEKLDLLDLIFSSSTHRNSLPFISPAVGCLHISKSEENKKKKIDIDLAKR